MSKGLESNIVSALGILNRYTGREDFIRHQKERLLIESKHAKCQAALQSQDAEMLRQLYVALTRAKHRLYIPLLVDTSHSTNLLPQLSPFLLFSYANPSISPSCRHLLHLPPRASLCRHPLPSQQLGALIFC